MIKYLQILFLTFAISSMEKKNLICIKMVATRIYIYRLWNLCDSRGSQVFQGMLVKRIQKRKIASETMEFVASFTFKLKVKTSKFSFVKFHRYANKSSCKYIFSIIRIF